MEQKIRYNKTIGNNLKRLRKEHKLSQEKLCAKLQLEGCDISRSHYSKYELSMLNIRADVLVTLQKIYQCDYAEFFKGISCGNDK